jgi:hypothetical protein
VTRRRYTPFRKPRKLKASPAFWKILAAAAGLRIESTVCQPVAKANFLTRILQRGRVMHLDRLKFSRRIHRMGSGSARAAALVVPSVLLLGCGSDDDEPEEATRLCARAARYASWAASPQDYAEVLPFPGVPAPEPQALNSQSLRQIVRLSAGGERVRLSNLFGDEPIRANTNVAGVIDFDEIMGDAQNPLAMTAKPMAPVDAAGFSSQLRRLLHVTDKRLVRAE